MSRKQIPGQDYISFTKEMKKDYKILVPMMLEMHFKLLCGVLRNYGYDVELKLNLFQISGGSGNAGRNFVLSLVFCFYYNAAVLL